MKRVASTAQSRELDRRVIEDLGLPGIALMEIASRGVAEAVRTHHRGAAENGILVVCGGGNNGGDGYGAARWLHAWGFDVRLLPITESSSGDAAVMRSVCEKMAIPFVAHCGEVGLIVDAVFGTGLSREVVGRPAERLAEMAAHPAEVVAVDIPSGLCGDTGAVLGVCAPAVRTVTLGRLKAGHLGEPGVDLCGEIEIVDIGLQASDPDGLAIAEVPEACDLRWPRRSPGGHKKSSGHLVVVAGSHAMSGAAVLTCRGALAAGAGLVTLVAPRGARLDALPPEVMVIDGGPGDVLSGLDLDLGPYTAVAAGPGLGGGEPLDADLHVGLAQIWASELPVVFDADALVAADAHTDTPRVITPHPGEAARLLGVSVRAVQADRWSAAAALAQGRTAVLKGRHSLVASPDRLTSVNPTGGPVLATAGSGDVLCGVVGALLARGESAHDAARLATWVHGGAGDLLAETRLHGWTAGDIATAIPRAIQRI